MTLKDIVSLMYKAIPPSCRFLSSLVTEYPAKHISLSLISGKPEPGLNNANRSGLEARHCGCEAIKLREQTKAL